MKKIAVIGLGSIGRRHLKNLKILYPEAEVIAVSSSGRMVSGPPDGADKFTSELGDEILKELDFAIVASPAPFHWRHASLMLQNQIPVLIEKPLCSTNADLEKFSRIADNAPATAVGYCLRFLSSASIVKEMIDKRQIGNIYNVDVHVGQYLPDWRKDVDYRESVSAQPSLGGGVLLEMSHELDYLAWLMGPLSLKYAMLRNSGELNLEVEEIADIQLQTTCGTICCVHLDFLQRQPRRFCTLTGARGRIDWSLINNSVSLTQDGKTKVVFSEPTWERNNMYLNMVTEFEMRISGTSGHCATLNEAAQTVALINAIKSQAQRGISQ